MRTLMKCKHQDEFCAPDCEGQMTGIIYIHVPKCGGSSFGAALRLRYLFSQSGITLDQGDPHEGSCNQRLNDYDARDIELKNLTDKNTKLICGHVRYSRALHQSLGGEYSFVTLLRDPVQRFVSHYNYLQRSHQNPLRPDTLKAFLGTDDAKRLASQYLFYFARLDQTMGANTDRLAQKAIANLSHFDLVGDLSAPVEFSNNLNRLAKSPLPKWQRNVSPEPTKIPPDLLGQIEDLCAADIEVYNTVHRKEIAA